MNETEIKNTQAAVAQNPDKKTSGEELVVHIVDVKKSFGTQHVLKGVSLDVRKGESVVIMGKSGTGKSVLIKCIVGLLTPDSGQVEVFGQNVPDLKPDDLNATRKRIGFLFQSGALYDSMSVRDNLLFPLRDDKKMSLADKTKLVEEALADVGLAESIDKMPAELSGGMRKRVGLARTIILKPEIILYDEPTTGLDPITTHEISLLIKDIKEKHGSSSIIITHDIECARVTADRITILFEGQFIEEGSMDELNNSENETVKNFFNPNRELNQKA
jgi:phospholipid/cholesterol/gamma-HCH transport system ATP-binding protein